MSILLVDDNADILSAFSTYLVDAGFEIRTACCAKEAIQRLYAGSKVDLIVLDLVMPNGGGYDLLEFLNSNLRFEHIPVLICSSLGCVSNVVRTRRAGAVDFLVKPVMLSTLLERVQKALTERKKTILIVGEDDVVLDAPEMMLERDGYAIVRAGDGKLALTEIDSQRIDCVVSAATLPDMDGWLDLLVSVKDKDSNLPFLPILRSEKIAESEPLAVGADGVISTPFSRVTTGLQFRHLLFKSRHESETEENSMLTGSLAEAAEGASEQTNQDSSPADGAKGETEHSLP